MRTIGQTVELAAQGAHGEWEHCGDFGSSDAAIAEALRLTADPDCPLHHDDFGTVVFGVSTDPDGGHYEDRIEVYADGTHLVL